jgi:hypothetical protein
VIPRALTSRLAAAVAAGGLVLTTGLAAAGALPTPAQGVAATVLGTVGMTVPSPDAPTGVSSGGSTTAPPAPQPADTKGEEIADLADPGPDHGDTVCAAASAGVCTSPEADDASESDDHAATTPPGTPTAVPTPSQADGQETNPCLDNALARQAKFEARGDKPHQVAQAAAQADHCQAKDDGNQQDNQATTPDTTPTTTTSTTTADSQGDQTGQGDDNGQGNQSDHPGNSGHANGNSGAHGHSSQNGNH